MQQHNVFHHVRLVFFATFIAACSGTGQSGNPNQGGLDASANDASAVSHDADVADASVAAGSRDASTVTSLSDAAGTRSSEALTEGSSSAVTSGTATSSSEETNGSSVSSGAATDSERPDAGSSSPTPRTLQERIEVLRAAKELSLWSVDVNGDGITELVLATVPTSMGMNALRRPVSLRAGGFVSTSGLSHQLAWTPVGIVLSDDPLGTLTERLEGAVWTGAEALVEFAVDGVEEELNRLFDAVLEYKCEIAAAALAVVTGAVVKAVVARVGLAWVRTALNNLLTGIRVTEVVIERAIEPCIESGQTPQACVAILIADAVGPLLGPDASLGAGPHCYDVSVAGGRTACEDGPVDLPLCDRTTDTTGCCNEAFIYEDVLLSDVGNQAPLPELPPGGPFEVSSGMRVYLAAPNSGHPIFPDVAACVANEHVVDCATADSKIGELMRAAYDLFTDSHNLITVTVERDNRCALNETAEYHMLVGDVRQCIGQTEAQVFSRIRGTGNGRLAKFNDCAGPYMLGTVRDHFRAAVHKRLEGIKNDNLCCKGSELLAVGSCDTDAGGGASGGTGSDTLSGGGSNNGTSSTGDGGDSQNDAGGGVELPPADTDVVEEPPGPLLAMAVSTGDPHLRTFDGMAYDIQPVGELILVESLDDELEIQIRTAPWGARRDVAVQVAVAARVGSDRVAVYGDGSRWLNGEVLELGNGGYDLPGGGELFIIGAQTSVVWPDGSQLRTIRYGYYFDVRVALNPARATRVRGLLGNLNSDRSDDLQLRDGAPVERPVRFDVLYDQYAKNWRIAQEESLFDYPEGQGTVDFTDLLFPRRFTTYGDLDPAIAQAARARCVASGITDPIWLEACALDLVLTEDDSFMDAFAGVPDTFEAYPVEPPADRDGDKIRDLADNCPDLPNGSQSDVDRDGVGDACDIDIDADTIYNEGDVCPTVADPNQADSNADGVGDACEALEPDPVPDGAGPVLTINVSPGGSVIAGGVDTCSSYQRTCNFQFDPASEISLVAQPALGYAFSAWSGDCSGAEPTFVLPLSGHARCTASFVQTGTSIGSAGPMEVVWLQDFEDGLSQWAIEGQSWEVGTPTLGPAPFSGESLAGTRLTGSYQDGQTGRLVSPSIEVGDASKNPRLQFAYWHELSSGDFGVVELSVDGGEWFAVSSQFIGTSGGWAPQVVLLKAYAGHSVRLGIRFESVNFSGGSVDVAAGIYVDDVSFATGEMIAPHDEDFESGFGDWSVEGGVWAWGIPFGNPWPLSGYYAFGTNLAGNYADNNGVIATEARLVSPELLIDDAEDNPRLKFNYWHDLSSADEVRLQISLDGGAWQNLPDAPIIGTAGGWSQRVVLLRDYVGHHVRVGLLLSTANYSGGSVDVADGMYVDDATFETGEMAPPIDEDFEGGFGDWSVEGGVWALGTPASGVGPTPLSGTRLFGTNLAGNYIDNNGEFATDARLVSPELEIDDASLNPRLKFNYWYELNAADEVRLQVSVDGGAWQALPDAPIIGTAGGWSQRVVLLREYAGHRVRVGLLLSTANYASGSADVAVGMYVDDVTFETGEMELPIDEDFESGFGDWSVEGGVWALGTPASGFGPAPLSGTRLFGTNLAGNYIDNNGELATDARLVSPEFVIDDAALNPRLKFNYWYELNAADEVRLQVSVDGGAWQTLPDAPMIGTAGGWSQRVVLLREYVGHRVRVGILLSTANYASGSVDVAAGIYVDDAAYETGEMALPIDEDFESGFGDWSVEGGVWALGTPASGVGPTPLSGTRLFGTNLVGDYIDNNGEFATNARLVSPEFVIDDATLNPRLKFNYWHDLNSADEVLLQVSVDGGAWQNLPDAPMIGTAGGWSQRVVLLRGYVGHRVRIGVLLTTANYASGSVDVAAGVYVEDATFEFGEMVLPTDENFESGFGDWSVEGGVWALGTPIEGVGPPPLSGTHVFGTNLAGNYLDNNGEYTTQARLVSPEFDAIINSPLFNVWHDLRAGDSARFQISVDGGPWTNLAEPALTGASGDWYTIYLTLPEVAVGSRVRVGLLLTTANASSGPVDVGPGVYIDDVSFASAG